MGLFVPILFVVAILASPWPIGGNYAFARTWFLAFSALALLLSLLEQLRSREPIRFKIPLVLLFAGVGYTIFQTVELPDSIRDSLVHFIGGDIRIGKTISVYPVATREKLVDLVMGIGVFLASASLLAERRRFYIILAAITIVGVALSFFGIAQNLSWNGKLFWRYELLQGGWPFASFVNKNNGAGFLLITFSASLFFVAQQFFSISKKKDAGGLILTSDEWESERVDGKRTLFTKFLAVVASLQPKHLYFGAAIAIIFAAIMISLSRGAMVALVAASTVGVLLMAHANRWLVVGLTMLMVGMGVGIVIYTEQTGAISTQLESLTDLEAAASSRFKHWEDAWPFGLEHAAVGTGNGTYSFVSPTFETDAYQRTYAHAENIYLETLVEMGVFGCLLLGALIVVCVVASVRLYRRQSSNDRALGLTGLSCLSGQGIAAFFDFGLYQPANTLIMAVLMGTIVGRASRHESDRGRSIREVKHPAESGAVVSQPTVSSFSWFSIAMIVLAIGGTGWALSESYWIETTKSASRTMALITHNHGDSKQQLRKLDGLESKLILATQFRPDDSEAHFQLGEFYLTKYRVESAKATFHELKQEIANSSLENTESFEMPSQELVWDSTSISILHREFRLAERNNKALAGQLRDTELSKAYLAKAYPEFLAAEACGSFQAKTQMRLAQLSAFYEPGNEKSHLEAALARAPDNSQILFDGGLLALNSGDHPLAIELWGRCLANPYSLKFEPAIVELSQMELPMKAMFEQVLPQKPEYLLRIASKYFDEPRLVLPKRFLLVHTKSIIQKTDLADVDRLFYLAEAERMSGKYQEAVTYYRKALQLEPSKVVWRFEYAKCLHQIGEFDEAIRQLKKCELEPSKIHSNIKPLLARIRRDRVVKHD